MVLRYARWLGLTRLSRFSEQIACRCDADLVRPVKSQEERKSHKDRKSDNRCADSRLPSRASVVVSHLHRLARNGNLSHVAVEEFSVAGGRVQIADRCPDIRIRYVNRCSPDLFDPCSVSHWKSSGFLFSLKNYGCNLHTGNSYRHKAPRNVPRVTNSEIHNAWDL